MESNLLIGRLSKITMERHDADVWQKPTQYGKAIILQFKVNKNKFKKNPERYISSFIPSPSIRFPTPTSQFLLDQVISTYPINQKRTSCQHVLTHLSLNSLLPVATVVRTVVPS